MNPLWAETERFWDKLLDLIEEERVVPILGQDLLRLKIGAEGEEVFLYPYLARRLAEELGIRREELPAEPTLTAVACRHLEKTSELTDVYPALKSIIIRREEPLPTPEALLKLAEIREFNLFVTTTFDPLLEQAVNQVRFQGEKETQVCSYSPATEMQDLPCEMSRLTRPVVFHLLGRLSGVPEYAVTEEDTLEFLYSLQSRVRPPLLFDELNRRHLLVIGAGFPDWLARFFIRTSRRERLRRPSDKTDILADARARDDPGLVLFLQHFGAGMRVFQGGGAIEFVAELHRRYAARRPEGTVAAEGAGEPAARTAGGQAGRAAARPGGEGPPPPPVMDMAPGAVFLSYAREDLSCVEAIRDALTKAGMEVWLDKRELAPGDPYEAKILSNIEECSVFVPVISCRTLTPRLRFFRLEWDHAIRVAKLYPPSKRFILPVAIDDVPESDKAVREEMRALHWARLPGGQATPEFVALVRQLYRDHQKSGVSAP